MVKIEHVQPVWRNALLPQAPLRRLDDVRSSPYHLSRVEMAQRRFLEIRQLHTYPLWGKVIDEAFIEGTILKNTYGERGETFRWSSLDSSTVRRWAMASDDDRLPFERELGNVRIYIYLRKKKWGVWG